jgi:hypothetical protein
MNWKGSIAITLIGAYAGAHAAHVKQQRHTTGSTGASVTIAADVGSAVSWGMFRAQQPMPIEILQDGVSKYLPSAPTTLVMTGDEMWRILEIWRDRLGS